MKKRSIKYLLRILVTLVTLFLLIRIIDFEKLGQDIRLVPWYVYLLSVLVSIFRTWLMGLRWKLLNPDISGQISNWQYFRFSMIAHVYNLIMPGALGGDIVKGGYVLNHIKSKRGQNIISIIVDRFIGLFSIFLIGIVSLLAIGRDFDINIHYFVFSVLLLSIVFIYILTRRKLIERAEKFKVPKKMSAFYHKVVTIWESSVNFYKRNSGRILLALIITLPVHIASFFLFYIWSVFLGIGVTFMVIVFSISMMWVLTALPISIGGLGVRELSLVYFLGLNGVSSDQAVALSAINYINIVLVALISSLFLVDMRYKRKSGLQAASEGYSREDINTDAPANDDFNRND